jgi:hypothetical protein
MTRSPFESKVTFGIAMDSSAVRAGFSARPRWEIESKNMVTKHFMENRMESAGESRKITKLIEARCLEQMPARPATGQVERRERAEDVFRKGYPR